MGDVVTKTSVEERLTIMSQRVRRRLIEIAALSRTPHVGSSLSCVDILVTLYFQVLQIDEYDWHKRDIFVMSKGHGALGLYTVLAERGLISQKELEGYFQDGGTLPAHLDRFSSKAIEVSAGSLGHGFNIALGMAHGCRLKEEKRKIVTLIGDGESQEGSIWEGAQFGSHLKLDNFTAILDYNNLQGYGRPTEMCMFEPVADKWRAFGWHVCEVDGHDYGQLLDALTEEHEGRPKLIVAKTTKGKGVSFMEDELKWHYFIVTDERKEAALEELGECNED